MVNSEVKSISNHNVIVEKFDYSTCYALSSVLLSESSMKLVQDSLVTLLRADNFCFEVEVL